MQKATIYEQDETISKGRESNDYEKMFRLQKNQKLRYLTTHHRNFDTGLFEGIR